MSLSQLKAVLPVAGLGTRMLPATKEQPKEMLPIFAKTHNGELCVKPLLHLVFEQLYNEGIREFIFVVGRGKRTVEDYFTPDYSYVELLKNSGKKAAEELNKFYKMIENSTLIWVNQPEPRGFGHAVLITQKVVGSNPFIVHAGDTYIISHGIERPLAKMFRKFLEEKAEAILLLQEVENPRQYGIAEITEKNEELIVQRVVEKPEKPTTNLAIMPIYIFRHTIFDALNTIKPGVGGELQLTDGIQELINQGKKVIAIKLDKNSIRLDIGNPTQYWEAIQQSYTHGRGADK